MRILILEDCAERRTIMLEHLADQMPMFGIQFFETSKAMIDEIKSHGLDDVSLIALDNDLEPVEAPVGSLVDAGTGVQVAEYLSTIPKENRTFLPVIIHTTNTAAAPQMEALLSESGWNTHRILPYDGEKWIPELWAPTARKAIISSVGLEKAVSPLP